MPVRLDSGEASFARDFSALLATKREISEDVDATVRDIIAEIIKNGDAALIGFTAQFDHQSLSADRLRITSDEIAEAIRQCAPKALDALTFARDRIEA